MRMGQDSLHIRYYIRYIPWFWQISPLAAPACMYRVLILKVNTTNKGTIYVKFLDFLKLFFSFTYERENWNADFVLSTFSFFEKVF